MLTDEIQSKSASNQQTPDTHDLIVQLFREYAAGTGDPLPPLEITRWRELVFAILTCYSQPDTSDSTVNRIVGALEATNLLDLETLAALAPRNDRAFEDDRTLVTLETIIERCGLAPESARGAAVAICEAAAVLHKKYRDMVQLCLRNYGLVMLDTMIREFSFSDPKAAREFLTIWLQRTLNMPIPASTRTTAAASADLGVSYDSLVEAADSANLHVGLLDEVLRVYLQDKESLALNEHTVGGETP